ncbi:MAG: chromate efflux transporter [Pseudomonadota bacterium]
MSWVLPAALSSLIRACIMEPGQKHQPSSSPIEVFLAFLKLGLTSFGGPIAHIGYFRKELVERRRWINEEQFGQLLAICQFLPGPASSQLGFTLGLHRAGVPGAIAAFIAFAIPSVLLLLVFASAFPLLSSPIGDAAVRGLKLVACAVVADAVISMARDLCQDAGRRVIAVLSFVAVLVVASALAQLVVIAVAALLGLLFLRGVAAADGTGQLGIGYGRRTGAGLLLVFAALLLGLPFLATGDPGFGSVADTFYRTGALVFGGGHVVLPLLQESVVSTGWVESEQFLAGYGAAQAIPGPLFAFSAYLGAVLASEGSAMPMAMTALVFIFLPGFLLVAGVLPFWRAVSHNAVAGRAIAGVNAAVVGLLAAALYDPIFLSGITGSSDLVIALIGFGLLAIWRLSPLIVVLWCVSASITMSWLLA